jgi:hypothetical protein
LPRGTVKITYTRAKVTPSRRARQEIHPDHLPTTKEPKGLSPLARYVIENEGAGLTAEELIQQFQEYDCEHREKSKIVTGHKEIFTCEECGLVEVKVKNG